MTEKILNLKLKYKNKFLDTARYKRDFKNKFFIGRDKYLFWQILDENFPSKFLFVTKSGSDFNLKLEKGMDVFVNKQGTDLTRDDLIKSKLLKKNYLRLDTQSTGRITFGGNWEIEYFFSPEYKYIPVPEEIAIVKRFARWPQLTHEQKFTRIFVVLGLLFTIIGLYIGEKTYVPPAKIDFKERLQIIKDIATRVEPEIYEEELVEIESEIDIFKKKAETEEKAKKIVDQAKKTSIDEYEEMFGSPMRADVDYESSLYELDLVGDILVVTEDGAGSVIDHQISTGSVLDNMNTESFDLLSISDGTGNLNDFEGLELSSTNFEEVDIASLGSDIGSLNITKIETRAQFEAVRRKFAGIKEVKESSIELQEISPETKSEITNINNIVNAYKPQISKLFIVESMLVDMYGTIEFELIILKNGTIEAVDVNAVPGSFFTDSFKQKAREIILKWKIAVKEPIQYSFRIKFIKQ